MKRPLFEHKDDPRKKFCKQSAKKNHLYIEYRKSNIDNKYWQENEPPKKKTKLK